MAQRCSVAGCGIEASKNGILHKFHRFPRDGNTLEQWKTRLKIIHPVSSDRVCSLHFQDSDYMKTNVGFTVLKPGAIPSLNLSVSEAEPEPENDSSVSQRELAPVKQEVDCRSFSFNYPIKQENGDSLLGSFESPVSEENMYSVQPLGSNLLPVREVPNLPVEENEKYQDSVSDIVFKAAVTILDPMTCTKITARAPYSRLPIKYKCSRETKESNNLKAFKCLLCNKEFSCKRYLLLHLSSHQSYHCKICQQSFNSQRDYKFHVSNFHENVYDCNQCSYSFSDLSSLNVHVHSSSCGRKGNKLRPFYCPICGDLYCNRSDLLSHMANHISPTDGKLLCEKCSTTYDNQTLLAHQCVHGEKTNLCCKICLRVFCSKRSLHLHLPKHGEDSECPECCQTFLSRHLFQTHLRNKHPFVFFFSCAYCSLIFVSKEVLEAHLLTHNFKQAKKVPCIFCEQGVGFSDSTSSHYHIHQFIHNHKENESSQGPSTDSCAGGSSSSIMKEDEGDSPLIFLERETPEVLEEHDNILTSERSQFQCEMCDLVFKNEDELFTHVNLHENRGDFSCIECGKQCYSNGALALHYQDHVNIKDESTWSSDEEM